MPIKKSSLEKKWYYRTVKVFFLILPILVAATALLKGYVNIPSFSQENIVDVLQSNRFNIAYIIGGLIFYYLILKAIWRGFLYIAFGGLENDIKKKVKVTGQTAASPTSSPAVSDKNEIVSLVAMLIVIICVYYAYFVYKPSPSLPFNINDIIKKGNTCVPTGCGKNWHSSCTNKCYASLSDCRQTSRSGCSNVNCRQCP